MRLTLGMSVLAAGLFVPLFAARGVGRFDFWWWLSANIVALLGLAVMLDRGWRKRVRDDGAEFLCKVVIGLASALVLYGLFYAGNGLARLLFPFAGSGIADVYAFKAGVSPVRIALLMLLVIGPGEELFWRGFLQQRFQRELGARGGFFAAAAIYTLMHAASGNLMLALAAAVCGLFWGWLYMQTGSVLINVVSHTAWDLAVFVLFPLG